MKPGEVIVSLEEGAILDSFEDAEERKELLSILDRQHKDARRCLLNDNVLPKSITYNGEKRGVTIEFNFLNKVHSESGEIGMPSEQKQKIVKTAALLLYELNAIDQELFLKLTLDVDDPQIAIIMYLKGAHNQKQMGGVIKKDLHMHKDTFAKAIKGLIENGHIFEVSSDTYSLNLDNHGNA